MNTKKLTGIRRDSQLDLSISIDQINLMRDKFFLLDKQKQGSISMYDLYTLFDLVGEELDSKAQSLVQAWVEEKAPNKKIDVNLALRAWNYLKETITKDEEDETDIDILNAFVAMGGNIDKTGVVKKQKLVDIIKVQFGLTIDIEGMFEEARIEVDDELTYFDFAQLLGSGESRRSSRICSIFSTTSLI